MLGGAAGQDVGAAPAARPNVVVIETDGQSLTTLHVMPNVQRLLAAQGATFENSFASWPLCCPSRATLLTGQYAHNHGVLGNTPPSGGYAKLDHSNTLAVWLQRAGYHTVHVGKYLNGYGRRDNETQIPAGWSEWPSPVFRERDRQPVRRPCRSALAYRRRPSQPSKPRAVHTNCVDVRTITESLCEYQNARCCWRFLDGRGGC